MVDNKNNESQTAIHLLIGKRLPVLFALIASLLNKSKGAAAGAAFVIAITTPIVSDAEQRLQYELISTRKQCKRLMAIVRLLVVFVRTLGIGIDKCTAHPPFFGLRTRGIMIALILR